MIGTAVISTSGAGGSSGARSWWAQPDSEARALLDRWAASPAQPAEMLTAEDVRRDDLAVLDLQRAPGELYSVEDVEVPGPAGTLRVRLYRPHPGRLHPVLFLHGGGFVIGSRGYHSPLRELALASNCLIVSPECRSPPSIPFLPRWMTRRLWHGGSTPRRLRSAHTTRLLL